MTNMSIQELGVDWTRPPELREKLICSIMAHNQSVCRVWNSLNVNTDHNSVSHRCIQKNRALKRIRANPDEPPSLWLHDLASNSHDCTSFDVGSTLLYQLLCQVLPPPSDNFGEWVAISNVAWDED
mmetsp:Transcript_14328/g.39857  ORF Transcript_14328/g.39857 Transcript_14328/m.39857 type:complete len:126 (+) Transcript_14328:434-811(+)